MRDLAQQRSRRFELALASAGETPADRRRDGGAPLVSFVD
jgi:hypothetical protein